MYSLHSHGRYSSIGSTLVPVGQRRSGEQVCAPAVETLETRLQKAVCRVGRPRAQWWAPLSKTTYLSLTDHRDIPVGVLIVCPRPVRCSPPLDAHPLPTLPGNGHCWCIYSPGAQASSVSYRERAVLSFAVGFCN